MTLETVLALVYGMAIGDAMGSLTDSWSLTEIKARFGHQGLQDPGESLILRDAEHWLGTPVGMGYAYHSQADTLHKEPQQMCFADGVPFAPAASVAAAYIVVLALNGANHHEYARRVVEFTDGMSESLDAAFYRLGHALAWSDEVGAMAHIGKRDDDECLVALGCYCLMRYPMDYGAALRRAVNSDGRSARLGWLVGGFMSAKLGMQGIPVPWRRRCEESAHLTRAAVAIHRWKGM